MGQTVSASRPAAARVTRSVSGQCILSCCSSRRQIRQRRKPAAIQLSFPHKGFPFRGSCSSFWRLHIRILTMYTVLCTLVIVLPTVIQVVGQPGVTALSQPATPSSWGLSSKGTQRMLKGAPHKPVHKPVGRSSHRPVHKPMKTPGTASHKPVPKLRPTKHHSRPVPSPKKTPAKHVPKPHPKPVHKPSRIPARTPHHKPVPKPHPVPSHYPTPVSKPASTPTLTPAPSAVPTSGPDLPCRTPSELAEQSMHDILALSCILYNTTVLYPTRPPIIGTPAQDVVILGITYRVEDVSCDYTPVNFGL